MNQDFVDLLRAFAAHSVRHLVVGAYALGVHGRPRATGDLDVWVEATPDNASRTYQARYAISNADPKVALGMTATVKLAHAGVAPVARLPLPAVMSDGREPSVFVVDPAGTAAPSTRNQR